MHDSFSLDWDINGKRKKLMDPTLEFECIMEISPLEQVLVACHRNKHPCMRVCIMRAVWQISDISGSFSEDITDGEAALQYVDHSGTLRGLRRRPTYAKVGTGTFHDMQHVTTPYGPARVHYIATPKPEVPDGRDWERSQLVRVVFAFGWSLYGCRKMLKGTFHDENQPKRFPSSKIRHPHGVVFVEETEKLFEREGSAESRMHLPRPFIGNFHRGQGTLVQGIVLLLMLIVQCPFLALAGSRVRIQRPCCRSLCKALYILHQHCVTVLEQFTESVCGIIPMGKKRNNIPINS